MSPENKRVNSAPPSKSPSLRTIAMPSNTNPNGFIFGGWIMSQMDLAAGNFATYIAKGPAVTVAIDGMTFHQPVWVGDEVSCYVDLVRLGRTSMTLKVETWARQRWGEKNVKVTEADFVFVAIDEDHKPREIPKQEKGSK